MECGYSTDMSESEMLKVTIRGGDHDGEVFELPAAEAGVGDTVAHLDAHYRLMRTGTDGWIGRVVSGDV